MKEILKVNNVVKYYGKGSVVTKAIDGISFSVNQGEFTAIMGASGSGKSTLLNVISTIDTVSSGDIWVGDVNIATMKENELSSFRRDKLGFIFQDYNLLDTLTIEENIALPLNLKKVSVQETQERLHRIVDILGITAQLKKFPYELSGGERQRASCARAMIADPSLILADEPTGALDSKNSKILMNTFEMMNESLNSTILMVTHDAEVGSYANRILFIKDGKIWNEIHKGDRTRKEMYQETIKYLVALGGQDNAL